MRKLCGKCFVAPLLKIVFLEGYQVHLWKTEGVLWPTPEDMILTLKCAQANFTQSDVQLRRLNSSRPSDTYMGQWTKTTLAQAKANIVGVDQLS